MVERVYFPLEEAVQKAAKQNFDRDVYLGLEKKKAWDELREIYEKEARVILLETGENYEPEPPHTVLICLEK